MIESYRVLRKVTWHGWTYAPRECSSDCSAHCGPECEGRAGAGCARCASNSCRCACQVPSWRFGGDILLVEAGHPRKDAILGGNGGRRFVTYDPSVPSGDELAEKASYKKLLTPPSQAVGAGRGSGSKPRVGG